MIKLKKLKNLKSLIYLKCLIFLILIIISCIEPPPCKNLNVPFRQQIDSYSCGAACVQMWANYRGNNVSQQTIINYMGITGATPSLIADAATICCNLFIIPSYFAGGPDEQNHSIADQLYSIRSGEPCVPIVDGGWHAVILKKACWHEESDGTPYIDDVWIHDPDYYYPWANNHFSIAEWKMYYESCHTGTCYCTVIYAGYASNPEAKAAYNEFRARGGTYYGERQIDRNRTREY